MSFRKFVVESEQLHVDLHIVLSDILQGAGELDLEPIAICGKDAIFIYCIMMQYYQ